MAAPATEDLRELERLLFIAGEAGETRSVASLREELAMGHDDLMAALDVLREHGKAGEETPGEWTGALIEPEPAPVVVHINDAAEGGAVDALDRFDGRRPGVAQEGRVVVAGPTVRLTRGIAQKLSPEALGQIVAAGLEDSEGVFTLEVLP